MNETAEAYLAEIEASFRCIHHYAGVADHPAMKSRVDGDWDDHLALVHRYAEARLADAMEERWPTTDGRIHSNLAAPRPTDG